MRAAAKKSLPHLPMPPLQLAANPLAVALLAAALFSASAPPIGAQTSAPEDLSAAPTFFERIDVDVVNLKVFVTDDAGRPITGLSLDDFELFEDDLPVPITNFFEVRRIPDTRDPEQVPPEIPIAASVTDVDRVDRYIVVYVDHANLQGHNRRQVLADLTGFVFERATAGDFVMLVGNGMKTEVVQPFTRDPDLLFAGLKKLGKAPGMRSIRDAERRRVLNAIFTADPREDTLGELRLYIEGLQSEVRQSAASLRRIVRSLSGLSGRKAVFYVSEGLEARPGEEIYEVMERQGLSGPFARIESLNRDHSRYFRDVVREANANQTTIYTVDARGGEKNERGNPENTGLTSVSLPVGTDHTRDLNLQESLISMSLPTGGKAILNTRNFDDAFAALTSDFDAYYSLGFQPTHHPTQNGNGEYHKLAVRLKLDGFRLRHRAGYVAKSAAQRSEDRAIASLVFGKESNPLGVSIEFRPAKKAGRGRFQVPTLIRIPYRNVTLLPDGASEEQNRGQLRILIVVRDDKGRFSEPQALNFPVAVPAELMEQARDQDAGYTFALEVNSRRSRLAVGLLDEISGTQSYITAPVPLDGGPPAGR